MTTIDPNIDEDHPVDTKTLAAILTKEGYPIAPATLNKLRCVGGGPQYIKFRRAIRYRPSVGRAWAAGRSQELRSTTEQVVLQA
jgi:hypothetical protein